MDRAALFIGGDSGPLHVAGTTGGAHRRPLRTDARRAVGAVAAGPFATESIDVADLPCRPCDQRQCEPGDFRCLG